MKIAEVKQLIETNGLSEELFEEFRADSIKMKEFMIKYHKHEYNSNTIIELNKQIEKLKNTEL